jgi:hypothetical protein
VSRPKDAPGDAAGKPAGGNPGDAAVDSLATAALDPKKFEDVARAIAQLTPEQAEHFAAMVRRLEKRHRIQLAGYVVSLVVLLGGLAGALLYLGSRPEGGTAWVMMLPLAGVGLVFLGFGRWARSVR